MKKPHIHAELIKAWADGSQIQWFSEGQQKWFDVASPAWELNYKYRIKPETKPDVVRWCWATTLMGESRDHDGENGSANLKIVFDGETGKLKSAEVL